MKLFAWVLEDAVFVKNMLVLTSLWVKHQSGFPKNPILEAATLKT
jgi:hypothetical protein